MSLGGLALATVAGMLAVVNPCGFALLPAYVALLVAGDGGAGPGGGSDGGRGRAVGRALALAGAMTAGFVAVFAVFGLVVAPLAGAVQRHLPWFTLVLGSLVLGSGLWLAVTGELSVPGLKLSRAPAVRRSVPSMALFGAAYAIASLGCTIAPFLAVVVSSLRAGSVFEGLAGFVAYAAGMGVLVAVVALAVAFARTAVIRGLRRLAPVVARAGGVLLALAGAYVAYYGWYETRVFSGRPADFSVIRAAGRVQQALAGPLQRAGLVAFAILVLVVAAGVGLAGAWAAARRRERVRR
jgi:cytochrome c-type biogenesis protein